MSPWENTTDASFSDSASNKALAFLSKSISGLRKYLAIWFSTYANGSDGTIDLPGFETQEMLDLYDIFSSIRKKCIEKWYIAELKFYPDGTWNIDFVYGEIPEVEDDDE